MQRVTVSLDDDLAEFLRAEVARGRAASTSAWIAERVRDAALERARYAHALAQEAQQDPLDGQDLDWVAAAVGRDRTWVEQSLGLDG